MLLTSGANSVLYINSTGNDKILINGVSKQSSESLIYKGLLLAGKNYIQISSLKQYTLIRLTFENENKSLELKLN
jgi:hypothetical protein